MATSRYRQGERPRDFVNHNTVGAHELAPEHFLEHTDWQEELLLRVDPPRVVRSQTSGGYDTMNVPSIGRVRCLMRRWSCLIILLRYLLDRTRTRRDRVSSDNGRGRNSR